MKYQNLRSQPKMQLVFIRHGRTQGNNARQYIGRTDEPLCMAGASDLCADSASGVYPCVQVVVSSPMRRCVDTAHIIYPKITPILVNGLQECDFGMFEGKTYDDLNGIPEYNTWINTAGMSKIPGGESRAEFSARCIFAFTNSVKALLKDGVNRAAYIVHGGAIMALLEHFGTPQKSFYDWQTENGGGYYANCLWQEGVLHLEEIKPLTTSYIFNVKL